jgi:hypothetical protein
MMMSIPRLHRVHGGLINEYQALREMKTGRGGQSTQRKHAPVSHSLSQIKHLIFKTIDIIKYEIKRLLIFPYWSKLGIPS